MSLPADGTDPDARLIERFKGGDQEAFGRIVLRYRKDVYRIAYRMTANHEDADDVAQETFLRAHRALGSFRGDASLRTWLFRIAMNLSINVGRSHAGRRTEDLDLERLPDAKWSEGPAGEKRLLASEEAARVRGAVGALPPRQKQVVLLRMYEEMAFHEIAAVLDCPIGTAKANFFHAMNNLRKALA
jgi:RNA polymerase sigma-70 factor (ECF subfamily)